MAFITVLCEILEFYVRSCFNLCDLRTFLHMKRKFLATVVSLNLIHLLNVSSMFFGIFCHFPIYNNQHNFRVDFIAFERKTPLTCIFFSNVSQEFCENFISIEERKWDNKLATVFYLGTCNFSFLKCMADGHDFRVDFIAFDLHFCKLH